MVLPYDNMDYGEDQIGARNIPELTDVELTNLANGEILKYNSSNNKWENQPDSAGGGSLDNLTDTNITTPITNGSYLVYNTSNGKWENAVVLDNDTLNNLSDTNISSLADKDFLLYDSVSSKWINTPSIIDNLKNVSILSVANNEILKYNNVSGKWENNNLNLNEIQDVNIANLQNGEVLKYNSGSGKWENQDNTDTLNELTDVTLTGSSNNQVLKYNGSIWVNNFVNLTELADTNIPALNNGDILRYNSVSQKWETDTFNIDDLDNVNITSVANNEVLKYNSVTGKWENSNRIDTLDELGDVTLTGVTTGDLLRYNGTNFVNTKIALDNDFTNVNFTSLTNGDLVKYDGSNFINFAPTYLDGAGISNNFLIKVVNGVATQTNMIETSILNTSTSLKIYIPAGLLSVLAGSIETEFFNTTKRRMHLTTSGIENANGITITSDGRVGIGVVEPEEDLEIDGNIQLDTGGVQRGRVIFYDKLNDHEHAEIDGLGEGANGGVLAFYTKVDGSSVTEKLRINNQGAIGIEGAFYGNSGQVIVSRGSGNPVEWADQTDTTYSAGTGVSISPSNEISIGQGVAKTDSVSFSGVGINTPTPAGLLEVRNSGTQYLLYGATGNLSTFDPEEEEVEVRLGAAYGRPGVYSSGRLELHSDTTGIIFGDSNVEKMRMNATGAITLQSDSGDCRFRNARMGNLYSNNYASFSAANFFSEANYALLQRNDAVGDTMLNAPSGANVYIRINNANKMIINNTGIAVGGNPIANNPFYVYGVVSSQNGFNGGVGGAAWFGTSFIGNIQPILNANYFYNIGTSSAQYLVGYAFSWSSSSDDRLKDNETDISGGLETIMKLKPQTYDFKSSEEPDAKHLGLRSGFIAQDVLEIPELAHAVNVPENETEKVGKELDESGNIVDSDKEKKCYLSLDYNTIFTHAVKAIQELNEKVKSLENEINILKNSSG